MASASEAWVVSAVRTPIGRSRRGLLAKTRPDDMLEKCLKVALRRLPEFDWKEIDDILIGCAFPEAEQGMNVARCAALLAGIPVDVPACTVNRFCASAMTCLHIATLNIWLGQGDIYIVGGTESMTMVPMGGNKPSPNIRFMREELPEIYISMGETAERIIDIYGDKYDLSREALDKFALSSHMKAVAAQKEGKFDDELIPLIVNPKTGDIDIYESGKIPEGWIFMDKDENPRADTSMEALTKLKPAFRQNGRLTAGNSSPLTDGASVMILMSSKKVNELGIEPLAKIRAISTAAVPPEVMGTGPVPATRKVLKKAGMTLEDIKLIELNEAFASQSLYCIYELGLNEEIVNVNGGAIALGHPLGISGTRITTTLIYEMRRRGFNIGLATMCVGGGQGTATIVEI